MINQFIKYFIPIFLATLCGDLQVAAQNTETSQDPIVIDLNEIENDGKRVEVQRYIGYENLLSRYLTLPYDISLNTSNQGRYFDIGFLLITMLPLALLLLVYKNKKHFYVSLFLIIFYIGISFSYSFVNINEIGPVYSTNINWSQLSSNPDKSTFQSILVAVHNTGHLISIPVRTLINYISGESDHITYPVLFLFLILSIAAIRSLFKDELKASFLVIIMTIYFFLWLLLSGGIIWYGFLLIPMLFACSFKIFSAPDKNKLSISKPLKYLLFLAISVWTILAYSARIGNIDYFTAEENKGKGIVDAKLIYYSAGIHSARESNNLVYNNIGNTFDQINANDGLIYQVGTSVTFNIKNNPERVFQDNILITFFDILNKYRDAAIITDVLKASGFKYIIIDLYTPTLDKTPEKSLTKKYQLLLSSLYESRGIRLMATDRIIEVITANRQVKTMNDVFVTEYNPSDQVKIKNHGSYAIYEIL